MKSERAALLKRASWIAILGNGVLAAPSITIPNLGQLVLVNVPGTDLRI